MATGPAEQAGADEAEDDFGPTETEKDKLRRMFRPLREVPVEGIRVLVPQCPEPVEVRLGRYLDEDERRELFLVCQDVELDGRPWMLLVFPHALSSEKTLSQMVDILAQARYLGDRALAWKVARACDHTIGIEREEWVEAKLLDNQELKALMGERTERLRELQAADERKDKGLLGEGKPPKKSKHGGGRFKRKLGGTGQ